VEDLERAKTKYESDFHDETAEIKREKRRLNDLLTLREEEIEKLRERTKLVSEKEQTINELERKLKHVEKKYEKQIQKLNHELSKFKTSGDLQDGPKHLSKQKDNSSSSFQQLDTQNSNSKQTNSSYSVNPPQVILRQSNEFLKQNPI
jgi:uncharacterized coiled-coil protein SlyX